MSVEHTLKPSEEILEFVRDRIANIYARPLMFGGTADGVDSLLHYYHELWAWIQLRREQFDQALYSVLSDEDCGAASFSTHFRRTNADAPEMEAARYVVAQWKRIDERLKLRHELQE